MSGVTLRPQPISAEAFAVYGDVITTSANALQAMNNARFERFNDLAQIDIDQNGDGHVSISVARSKTPTTLPHRFDLVERHPLGSQAFVPLARFSFIVVVAPPGESVDPEDLRAFVTNGSQGVNYHKGVWHMPLIATGGGQSFLVVDRAPGHDNCEERVLGEKILLQAP
jgi:ureidoglycolate lyase